MRRGKERSDYLSRKQSNEVAPHPQRLGYTVSSELGESYIGKSSRPYL